MVSACCLIITFIFMQEKSYYALAAFCENMGEDILPFLDPLMGRLLTALQNSSRVLQETCMVCGRFSML